MFLEITAAILERQMGENFIYELLIEMDSGASYALNCVLLKKYYVEVLTTNTSKYDHIWK